MEIFALIDLSYFIFNDIKDNISDEHLKFIKENSIFMKFKKSGNFDANLMDSVLDFGSFKLLIDGKLTKSQENYVNLNLDKFLDFLKLKN